MRLAACLVLIVVCAGCGGSDGSTAAKLPPGLVLRVVADGGFSIGIPAGWRSLDSRQAMNGGRFDTSSPSLRTALRTLRLPHSPIKLIATGPVNNGFLTNLNVILSRIPAQIPFEEWSKTEVLQLQRLGKVKALTHEQTSLAVGPALHLTYHATAGKHTAFVHQYFVKNRDFLYVLTYTTLQSLEVRFRMTFEASARTFRLSR
jgi:hypothetical protein